MKTTIALMACAAATMVFGSHDASAQSFYARQHLGISRSSASTGTVPSAGAWYPDSTLTWDCPSRQGLAFFQYSFACYASATEKVDDSRCAGSGARPASTPALPSGETCTLVSTKSLH
jgi:hypothetical protein